MSRLDYQRIFEAVPMGVLVLDPGLFIVAANQAYMTATMRDEQGLIGRHMFEAFPDNPDDPGATGVENLRRSLETVLATGRSHLMAVQKYDIVRPDGTFEERHWTPLNVPVLSADGRVEAILHTVSDVSDIVRLRSAGARAEADLHRVSHELATANQRLGQTLRELGQRTELVEAHDRAKDRFIAVLSHELRNPLAGIVAARDVLADEFPAEHPALGVLRRQTAALARMTDDLLDASRAFGGKLHLTRRRVDLRDVVVLAAGDARPAFHHDDRRLSVSLPPDPVLVDGDPVRLAQVVGNLLDNARRFSPRDGRTVVEVTVADGTAVLEVRDDGVGFDPAVAESLFEMFVQRDGTTGRSHGHLGIGLALVGAIAREHGGSATAASTGPGTGAQFTVTLPLAAGEDPDPPGRVEPPGAAAPSQRILIVDDHRDFAAMLAASLSTQGHVVDVAHSGAEGVAAAGRRSFDVVLCDLGLPDIDGCEVARRLRRTEEGPPALFVAVTGFGGRDDRERTADAGFDVHLTKPVEAADILRLLAVHTGLRADD